MTNQNLCRKLSFFNFYHVAALSKAEVRFSKFCKWCYKNICWKGWSTCVQCCTVYSKQVLFSRSTFCRTAGKSFQKLAICMFSFESRYWMTNLNFNLFRNIQFFERLQTSVRILTAIFKRFNKVKIFTGIQYLFVGNHPNEVSLPCS